MGSSKKLAEEVSRLQADVKLIEYQVNGNYEQMDLSSLPR